MNNPPAFPSHGSMGEVTQEGMTLRDYFAAKAMEKLMEKKHDSIFKILKKYHEHDDAIKMSQLMIADIAYAWADAMMEAREAE
jgi:hypothetical protein